MNRRTHCFVRLLTAVWFILVCGSAHAISTTPDIVDFNITSTNGGTLVWDVASNRLIGANIKVNDVVSQTLPDLAVVTGPVLCSGCVLNFISGTNTGGLDFSGDLGGSSITISTDQVLANGATGLLMSGTFTNGSVLNLGSIFRLFGGGFTDIKDQKLSTELGFADVESWVGGLNLQFAAVSGFSKGSTLSVLSGDITNIPVRAPSEVPLPGAAWLLGAGMLGLLKMSYRRKSDTGDTIVH